MDGEKFRRNRVGRVPKKWNAICSEAILPVGGGRRIRGKRYRRRGVVEEGTEEPEVCYFM
jgi:hypothetical protein